MDVGCLFQEKLYVLPLGSAIDFDGRHIPRRNGNNTV